MKTEQIVQKLKDDGHEIFTINSHEVWYIDKDTKKLRCLFRPKID